MTIKEVQDLIVEEFSAFDEWMDKYEYIIELGKSLEMESCVEQIHKTG